jgi:Domain of unknown function (DUF929)
MVDWDRVEELRSKDWSWSDIAKDPKVGFHPDASAGDPGRALRAVYHRNRGRIEKGPAPATTSKRAEKELEHKWTPLRGGFLAVPFVGMWFVIAYVAPSPVGLLVPALPYLGLALAAIAFVFIFALWRTRGTRWSPVFRTTLIGGVILGLVFAGMVGLVGTLAFGCPYLPPASTLTSEPYGWSEVNAPAWEQNGMPVVYFYGATWCPYCSASSWVVWGALREFGTVTGNSTGYSSPTDVYPQTAEMVLANVQVASSQIAFQVSEYAGGVDGTPPSTSSCVQQAYVSAYSGGSIPFVVIDGKYVHFGSSLFNPQDINTWAAGANGGAGYVAGSVVNEKNVPWTDIEPAMCWMMTFMAKAVIAATGTPIATIASENHWTSSVTNLTEQYLAEI